MSSFKNSAASTVDTSAAYDQLQCKPQDLVGQLFMVKECWFGMSKPKTDPDGVYHAPREIGTATIYGNIQACLKGYTPAGAEIFDLCKVWLSDAMLLQMKAVPGTQYPLTDCTLVKKSNGAYEFGSYGEMEESGL